MLAYTKASRAESIATEFGFYPICLEIKTEHFSVINLPEYTSLIDSIKKLS